MPLWLFRFEAVYNSLGDWSAPVVNHRGNLTGKIVQRNVPLHERKHGHLVRDEDGLSNIAAASNSESYKAPTSTELNAA